MKGSQLRCFWLYALLVILLTSIPYMLGFAGSGENSIFTGFVFGVEDGNSYIAKMLLGSSGDWLFRTPYSAAPQRGVLAFLPYMLLGKLAAGSELHLQLVLLYHLFRIAVIPLGIWATYRFAEFFLPDTQWSSWATVLATIGSGLGWVPVLAGSPSLFGSLPLGFISPETFGFLSYYGLPHLILARAFLLLGLRWYLESPEGPINGWKAGAVFAALGLVQPLTMVPLYALIGVHQIVMLARSRFAVWDTWREQWLTSTLRLLIISSPIFIYYLVTFSTDPFLKLWTEQNLILSPHPSHYLLAYGLLLPFVIVGLIRAWSTAQNRWLLLFAWVLIIPLLAYAPHNLQRRLPEGSWTAIVILAGLGIRQISIRDQIESALRISVVILSLITPALLVFGGIQVGSSVEFPAFRDRSEIEAFDWLAENAEKDAVVLTSFSTGNALPAWAPVHVVIGHGPESANLAELKPLVQAFFNGEMEAAERTDFLDKERVDYVFVGPRELEMGAREELKIPLLQQVYQEAGYSIYQVAEQE